LTGAFEIGWRVHWLLFSLALAVAGVAGLASVASVKRFLRRADRP
jgi:hypothetical protein